MFYKIIDLMKTKIDHNDLPASAIGQKKFELVKQSIISASIGKFDEAKKTLTEAIAIDKSGDIDTEINIGKRITEAAKKATASHLDTANIINSYLSLETGRVINSKIANLYVSKGVLSLDNDVLEKIKDGIKAYSDSAIAAAKQEIKTAEQTIEAKLKELAAPMTKAGKTKQTAEATLLELRDSISGIIEDGKITPQELDKVPALRNTIEAFDLGIDISALQVLDNNQEKVKFAVELPTEIIKKFHLDETLGLAADENEYKINSTEDYQKLNNAIKAFYYIEIKNDLVRMFEKQILDGTIKQNQLRARAGERVETYLALIDLDKDNTCKDVKTASNQFLLGLAENQAKKYGVKSDYKEELKEARQLVKFSGVLPVSVKTEFTLFADIGNWASNLFKVSAKGGKEEGAREDRQPGLLAKVGNVIANNRKKLIGVVLAAALGIFGILQFLNQKTEVITNEELNKAGQATTYDFSAIEEQLKTSIKLDGK